MDAIIDWLATGERGISSETIALTALGRVPTGIRFGFPLDPDDLRRCVLLLDRAPEARELAFPILGQRCPVWRALIAEWDRLAESLRRECDGRLPDRGYWERFYCGDTYTSMRAIIEKAQHA